MINHFRKHMKRPLIGIGHSMGGNHLVNLSLMHPRLLTTLVLIDPVFQRLQATEGSSGIAGASSKRRDRWPSRKDARTAFLRSKFYQAWDPRVFDKWIEHGLRELPTFIHPELSTAKSTLPVVSVDPSTALIVPDKETEREVTLKTTKHQEVLTFLRANYATPQYPDPSNDPNPITHPDVDPATGPNSPFYRPEPVATFPRLQHVRPSVLYLFGGQSDVSSPLLRNDKLANTGVGPGGSGGVKKGRVASVIFEDIGHLIPMEVVSRTADAAADWIVPELHRYYSIEEEHNREWSKVPKQLKPQMDEKYMKTITTGWAKELQTGYVQKVSKL
jgi:pimeloyl-ACP methyl ester carboxylesterase